MRFNVEAVKVESNVARAEKTFRDAVLFLKGPIPEDKGKCEYCSWVNQRFEID